MDISTLSPTVLAAGAAGSVLGFLTSALNLWHQRQVLETQLKFQDIDRARQMQNKNVSYDRHVIVIAMMLWVGLLYAIFPFIAGLCHLPVVVQYIQTNGGLLSLFSGNIRTDFEVVTGFVMSPYIQFLATYMFTFYMGYRT